MASAKENGLVMNRVDIYRVSTVHIGPGRKRGSGILGLKYLNAQCTTYSGRAAYETWISRLNFISSYGGVPDVRRGFAAGVGQDKGFRYKSCEISHTERLQSAAQEERRHEGHPEALRATSFMMTGGQEPHVDLSASRAMMCCITRPQTSRILK
ncbi:hypothetical protein BDW22DRAFT_1349477 [Trametopsis cervina]|nr:hypothetical protein BDW22DRAFT_1349477 [Trametopsis cervina]